MSQSFKYWVHNCKPSHVSLRFWNSFWNILESPLPFTLVISRPNFSCEWWPQGVSSAPLRGTHANSSTASITCAPAGCPTPFWLLHCWLFASLRLVCSNYCYNPYCTNNEADAWRDQAEGHMESWSLWACQVTWRKGNANVRNVHEDANFGMSSSGAGNRGGRLDPELHTCPPKIENDKDLATHFVV